MTTETQAPDPAPDHLELFKEAGEWAETMKRKLTPDMIELLGWLTGAAQAWAEKVEAQAAIPAPEGAQLPPDQLADKCEAWLQAGGASNIVDAYEAGYREAERAALAAPAPQAPVPLTVEQIIDATVQIDVTKPTWVVKLARAVEAAHGISAPQTKEQP